MNDYSETINISIDTNDIHENTDGSVTIGNSNSEISLNGNVLLALLTK